MIENRLLIDRAWRCWEVGSRAEVTKEAQQEGNLCVDEIVLYLVVVVVRRICTCEIVKYLGINLPKTTQWTWVWVDSGSW